MSEYWKSNEKHFCDVCKCWMAGHKAVIRHHESGLRHQGAVQAKLKDVGRKTHEKIKSARETLNALQAMEAGALSSFSRDLKRNPNVAQSYHSSLHDDNTAQYGPTFKPPTPSATSSGITNSGQQALPQLQQAQLGYVAGQALPNYYAKRSQQQTGPTKMAAGGAGQTQLPEPIVWAVAKTEDGTDYYWNMQTGQTSWEPPSCPFLTYADQEAAPAEEEEEVKKPEPRQPEQREQRKPPPKKKYPKPNSAVTYLGNKDRSQPSTSASGSRASKKPQSDDSDGSDADEGEDDKEFVDHAAPDAQGGRAGGNPFGEWEQAAEHDKEEFRHSFKEGHTRQLKLAADMPKRFIQIKPALKVKPEEVVTTIEEKKELEFKEKTITQPVSASRFKKSSADSGGVTFKKRRIAAQNTRSRGDDD